MGKYLYNVFNSYLNTLYTTGYVNNKKVQSLLILLFIYNLVFNDYRGIIQKEDYNSIEKALNCLYGTNCLIPYIDYLKMGKLKIGEYAEVLSKILLIEKKYEGIVEDIPHIKKTEVVKPKSDKTIQVDNIQF